MPLAFGVRKMITTNENGPLYHPLQTLFDISEASETPNNRVVLFKRVTRPSAVSSKLIGAARWQHYLVTEIRATGRCTDIFVTQLCDIKTLYDRDVDENKIKYIGLVIYNKK